MNKIILKTLLLFCLIATSCKTKGIEDKMVDQCELFKIGNYKFYNPRVYDRPVIFKKESHDLLHNEYVPIWYPGYCAVNLPSYFNTKEDYVKHIHSSQIKRFSSPYFEEMYNKNKDNLKGVEGIYHKDYHLLFRGTVSVKNLTSGNEYLLVAGKSYIANEADYNKNTEFYESDVKTMFAFMLENGVYKYVDVDLVVGTFTKPQHEQVYDILNAKTLVDAICFENVNTIKKPNFDSSTLPGWVHNKSELDE
ncbi:hypothetical protein A8C32_19300 [Flavivirga aquatica]|uniref:Lipoprotein n=1 Tax=Flavivirga aquatica TaxID=1849968 RepID=A0A1E5T467_9FLAO|nr:hypothetical protein [Flavivirga aquatica]OEK06174.1 hypothetical protein A8C32_19300 [Flavivirga aquatica]